MDYSINKELYNKHTFGKDRLKSMAFMFAGVLGNHPDSKTPGASKGIINPPIGFLDKVQELWESVEITG